MKTLKEGHGLTEVSCPHNSRWIWWNCSKKWVRVIFASNCDCGEPPRPFKKEK